LIILLRLLKRKNAKKVGIVIDDIRTEEDAEPTESDINQAAAGASTNRPPIFKYLYEKYKDKEVIELDNPEEVNVNGYDLTSIVRLVREIE